MNGYNIGDVAVGAFIVALLDFIVVVLVKTETILKYVERIKKILKLDYRSRAKRIDDEVRLFKKYDLVAKERVKRFFSSMEFYGTKWCWDWDEDFLPIIISGRCTGNRELVSGEALSFNCEHPVTVYFLKSENEGVTEIGIFCSQEGRYPHSRVRATFEFHQPHDENESADDFFGPYLEEIIIKERDKRIANEIKKLRRQFWR